MNKLLIRWSSRLHRWYRSKPDTYAWWPGDEDAQLDPYTQALNHLNGCDQ